MFLCFPQSRNLNEKKKRMGIRGCPSSVCPYTQPSTVRHGYILEAVDLVFDTADPRMVNQAKLLYMLLGQKTLNWSSPLYLCATHPTHFTLHSLRIVPLRPSITLRVKLPPEHILQVGVAGFRQLG